MKLILLSFIIFCSTICGAQKAAWDDSTSSTIRFVDERNNETYPVILVDSLWWFNRNLNYPTSTSVCWKNKERNCPDMGQLYYYDNAVQICPENWRLPTLEEFEVILDRLGRTDQINSQLVMPYPMEQAKNNPIDFNLDWNGLRTSEKLRRYRGKGSLNFWLLKEAEEETPHVHIYDRKEKKKEGSKLTLFAHEHEDNEPVRYVRQMGVRCVCELHNWTVSQ